MRKTRHRHEDNIRMDLKERGWKVVDQMHVVQDRGKWWVLVNTVMNLLVPRMWGIS
jgi:streptomycin 6-kinase